MNKSRSGFILTVLTTALFVLSVITPWTLDKHNSVLDAVISNGSLLLFLSILVAFTLFSITHLHFILNKMEIKITSEVFNKTRDSLKLSAYGVITSLAIAVILMSLKSVISNIDIILAMISGTLLVITSFNILVLIDIIRSIFAIKPAFN